MAQILDLNAYRSKKRQDWAVQHHSKLEVYLSHWFGSKIELDYIQVAQDYQSDQYSNAEEAWDYLDLRSMIEEELSDSVLNLLYKDLESLPWFDSKLFSREKLLEICTSFYIMNSIQIGS